LIDIANNFGKQQKRRGISKNGSNQTGISGKMTEDTMK
jgi:hypothetical protein